MSNIWLYPINEGAGYYLSFKKKEWPPSPSGFAEMVRSMVDSGGKSDDRWTIHSNRNHVKVGDKIIVYAAKKGRRPPLIVGFGSVSKEPEWYADWKCYTISIQWDLEKCMDLASSPIDATYVMDRLPSQKGAVVRLPSQLQDWICRRLSVREKIAERIASYLESVQTARVRRIPIEPQAYQALLRHDARLVSPFRARLVRAGWDVLRTRRSDLELEADIVALHKGQVLLVEAKTNWKDDGRREIRYAIGQLLEYEHFLVPHIVPKATRKTFRLILLEQRPDPKLPPLRRNTSFSLLGLLTRHFKNLTLGLKRRYCSGSWDCVRIATRPLGQVGLAKPGRMCLSESDRPVVKCCCVCVGFRSGVEEKGLPFLGRAGYFLVDRSDLLNADV